MSKKHNWMDDFEEGRVAGNILWRGKPGDETFHGKGGNDTISGFTGNDKLYGGKGNDGLYGQADNDKLYGEDGNDRLDGGAGNDGMWGGADADTFVFSSKYKKDTIYDFQADGLDHDIIDIGDLKNVDDYDTLVESHMSLAKNGKDVIIEGDHGDKLVIKGVTLEELNESHFYFF